MHIKGGRRGQKGNPLDHTDEGVFISKINSGGAAKRDGRLKVCIYKVFHKCMSILWEVNLYTNINEKRDMNICPIYLSFQVMDD